ncbi:MAG: hypothetical protein K6E10_05190 [Eubacterium sp.]|nr:hypothetical protein [Eubacterium sp.]
MKNIKKRVINVITVAVLVLGFATVPITTYASAINNTSPGTGWYSKSAYYGYWYVRNSGGVLGSNYYTYVYDYSRASVENGKGQYSSSSWLKGRDAWAQRPRTWTGTNSTWYAYK